MACVSPRAGSLLPPLRDWADSEPTIDVPAPRVWVDDDTWPTLSVPGYARLVARSRLEDGEAPASEVAACAASGERPCVRAPDGRTRSGKARAFRAAADFAALAITALLLIPNPWVSGSASRLANESAALAREVVGCPSPHSWFARAPNRSPAVTVKRSYLHVRAVHAPRRPVRPRPGIIRATPF